MIINKHGSFYIRDGWPTKVILTVRDNPHIFSPNSELEAIDELGLGRVMIRSLRYWSDVLGLTTEGKDQQGIISIPTPLFFVFLEQDKYFQKPGSLLLLHRNLCINDTKATAWYWAFNEFVKPSFTKEEFVDDFNRFIIKNGGSNAKTAIEKEFNCFKNTYLSENKTSLAKLIENDTVPFFAPLNILKNMSRETYQKNRMLPRDIPLEILFYCIIKDNSEALQNNKQIDIDSIVESKKQVSKYFCIPYSSLIEMLQGLENKGYLKLHNNFGNRHIELIHTDVKSVLTSYYGENITYEV